MKAEFAANGKASSPLLPRHTSPEDIPFVRCDNDPEDKKTDGYTGMREIWEALKDAAAEQVMRYINAYCAAASEFAVRRTSEDIPKDLPSASLYAYISQLMDAYRKAVELYEYFHNGWSTPGVKDNMDGIITVLISRLREFEDMLPSENADLYEYELDQIKLICEQKTGTFAKEPPVTSCEIMFSGLIRRIRGGSESAEELNRAVFEAVANSFNEDALKEIYEAYHDILTRVHTRENHLRQLYSDLLQNEMEIICTLVKVQGRALELAIDGGNNFSSQSNTPSAAALTVFEKLAANKILGILTEAYNRLEGATAANKPGNESGFAVNSEIIPFEIFEDCLLSGIEIPEADQLPYRLAGEFASALEKEAGKCLNRSRQAFFKDVYRLRRIVCVEIMLAKEMAAAFRNMRSCWPDLSEGAEQQESDIMHGIAETIEIKVEGMSESSESMQEECFLLIKNLSSVLKDEPPEKRAEEQREIFESLLAGLIDGTASADNCGESHRYKKRTAECEAVIEKKILNFKRETLLYEVSTYEEVIRYSVSRLRESENESVRKAVALADETLSTLETLLRKNNIEFIRPQPHDIFNAREHEVLMAEPYEDFKKGEVVKLLSSGYRQNDTVILRANVIAAR